jgi:integrase
MRLTDIVVKRLPTPRSGNKVTYDSAVKGFGCRVTAAGSRAFVLTYRRKADGRQRRITIGSFPDWSTAAARSEAARLKRNVDGGADPIGELEASRAAATVADLCARFTQEVLPRNRASTQRDYRQQIAADILPAIGGMKVAAVGHADVDDLHRRISKRAPVHANRVVALLSRLFSLAVRWGMRSDNPCKGIERNQEEKRVRYLSAVEIDRLSTALADLRDQGVANAVRLLLLTGARRGELLAAKWADLDLEAKKTWVRPAATTKQQKTHSVPLSEAACRLLTEMRKQTSDSEWLFPAPRKVGHRTDIEDSWNTLRKRAKLPGVRLHDLRHTYASVLASAGLSLPVIGALLGHTTPTTTHRYAHLFDDPLRAATERAAAVITGKGKRQGRAPAGAPDDDNRARAADNLRHAAGEARAPRLARGAVLARRARDRGTTGKAAATRDAGSDRDLREQWPHARRCFGLR